MFPDFRLIDRMTFWIVSKKLLVVAFEHFSKVEVRVPGAVIGCGEPPSAWDENGTGPLVEEALLRRTFLRRHDLLAPSHPQPGNWEDAHLVPIIVDIQAGRPVRAFRYIHCFQEVGCGSKLGVAELKVTLGFVVVFLFRRQRPKLVGFLVEVVKRGVGVVLVVLTVLRLQVRQGRQESDKGAPMKVANQARQHTNLKRTCVRVAQMALLGCSAGRTCCTPSLETALGGLVCSFTGSFHLGLGKLVLKREHILNKIIIKLDRGTAVVVDKLGYVCQVNLVPAVTSES